MVESCSPTLLQILIFPSVLQNVMQSNNYRKSFCNGHRQPDAVAADQHGEEEYTTKLEHQGSAQRQDTGHSTVVQGSKEGSRKNIEAAEEEGQIVQADSIGCQGH